MKTFLVLPTLLMFTLVGCKTSSNPASAPVPSEPQAETSPAPRPHLSTEPKYGWKEFHAETFETHPQPATRSERQFAIPGKTSRLRVKLNVSSATLGGVVTNDLLSTLKLPHKVHRAADFPKMACFIQSANKASATCDIDSSKKLAFLVRDARAETTKPAGILGIKSKSQRLAEQAVPPDKISISLSTWQCIENCMKP